MKVTIKLFAPGAVNPRFVGELKLARESPLFDTPDIRLLWEVERAINNSAAGRCHVEVSE